MTNQGNTNTKSRPRKNTGSGGGRKLTLHEVGKQQQAALRRMNNLNGQVFCGNSIRWLDRTVVDGKIVQRLLTKADFESALAGQYIPDDDGNPMAVATWYMKHPERMVYDEMIFDPALYFADKGTKHVYDPERPHNAALNLFTGWSISPNTLGSCEKFYQHLRDNYTSGDPVVYKAVLDWMAHLFQYPGKPIGWALAVHGDMGSGKSVVSDVLMAIVGRKYAPVFTTPESMLGKFNSAMGQCIVARVEEAFNPRDKRHVATLRNILSGGDTLLELKGFDAVPVQLRANVVFTSNDSHFLTAGAQGERRYLAFRCSNGAQQDGNYFNALKRQMKAGGYSKLLSDLLARDISAVDFTSPPRTVVLSQQIRCSLQGLERWWADVLEAGELIFARENDSVEPDGWADWIAENPGKPFSPIKATVVASAASYARDYAGRAPTPGEVGKFLIANAGAKVVRTEERKVRVQRYVIPPLDECRAMFSEARPGLRVSDLGGDVDHDGALDLVDDVDGDDARDREGGGNVVPIRAA